MISVADGGERGRCLHTISGQSLQRILYSFFEPLQSHHPSSAASGTHEDSSGTPEAAAGEADSERGGNYLPHTLHPTPNTLNPTSNNLHPTPHALHPR